VRLGAAEEGLYGGSVGSMLDDWLDVCEVCKPVVEGWLAEEED
jgi:hypothetical protein